MKQVFRAPKSLKPDPFRSCPGCGLSIIHRLLAGVIDERGIQEDAIGVPPAGCAVLAYNYLNADMSEAPHGRGVAVAMGLKKALPDKVVFTYRGNGDLAAMDTGESIHAANRGESITAIFVNNGVYGMTGGQTAATAQEVRAFAAAPQGRAPASDGAFLDLSAMLALAKGAAYIERVAVDTPKNIRLAKRAVKKAFQTQLDAKGFALVERLSACPTDWKMSPAKALERVETHMMPIFPPGGAEGHHTRRPGIVSHKTMNTPRPRTGPDKKDKAPALTRGALEADVGHLRQIS